MARPLAPINWKTVEDLLIAGCSGANIAGYFGLQPNTIYRRCEDDHGITFTEYSQQFYSKGECLLRAHQFAKALGKTQEGDNTLLIWLGKVRLKQREEHNVSEEDKQQLNAVIEFITNRQKNNQTSSDSSEENNP